MGAAPWTAWTCRKVTDGIVKEKKKGNAPRLQSFKTAGQREES
jgi:hypothetical protein